MSDDAFPHVTTDQIDDERINATVAWWNAPEGLQLEAQFPGYLRTMLVCHLVNQWEEREPGAARLLPPSLAIECALIENAAWQAVNDPLVPNPEWLAARIAETGGKC